MLDPDANPSRSILRLTLGAAVVGAAIAVAAFALTAVTGTAHGSPPALQGGYGSYEPAETPMPAPGIDFLDPDGRSIKLDAYRGQVLLVNFWATWCAPCVKELPSLEALQAALGGPSFRVVLISIDRKGGAATEPFLAKLGISRLPSHHDPKAVLAGAMGARGLPTSLIVNADGQIVGRLLGDADWNSDAAHALIRYYLDGEPK